MQLSYTFLLTLAIFCGISKAYCQGWTDPKDLFLNTERKFSDEEINQLKNTQTVFFYPGYIRPHLDSLKRVVAESWDITKVIFDDISNAGNYMDPKYSFFDLEGVDQGSRDNSSVHYFLCLRLITDVTKKGKIKTIAFCRIDLFPDGSSLEKKAKHGWGKDPKTSEEVYEEGIFYNFSPVLIKAQLERVAGNIKNKIRPKMTEAIRVENLGQLLSNDTLYVPASILIGYDPFAWKDKKNKDNIFDNYPNKYRICTDDELYTIFEKEQRGRLLFEYVRSSAEKIVTIYDLKDKKLVYRQESIMSYNLKSKDIDRLLD